MPKHKSKSLKDTQKIAKQFLKNLTTGQTFIFTGDLGGGKTTFTKALAKELKIKKIITSPTFVLLKTYSIKNHPFLKTLCHIDVYRLSSADELLAIGINEYQNNPTCLTIIEWGEKIKNILDKPQTVFFKTLGKNSREIIF